MYTKKDEVITCTSSPMEMKGKYLAERVVRSWNEEFVDEDTGDIVPIERHEIIMDRGVLLENEMISSIMFYIQSGEIDEVKVSNQRREGIFVVDEHSKIWSAVIEVNRKKVKLLLYANSFDTATEIVKDYVEQCYSGFCKLSQLKEFGHYTIIEEAFSKENVEVDQEKKLYKMEVNILKDESIFTEAFIVFATDAESSMAAINYWLENSFKKQEGVAVEFSTTIESATIISYSAIIDKTFSDVYITKSKKEEEAPSIQVTASARNQSSVDDLFPEVAKLIVSEQNASTSLIQRKFSIGYNRAGRLMDELENVGIVGPFQGAKKREVLITDLEQLKKRLEARQVAIE